jgi:Predicted integral membrane protein (DUF2269)
MSLSQLFYSVALFLHILSVLGLYIAIGLEWTMLQRIRQASTVTQVREWLSIHGALNKVHAVVGPAILLSGLYMTLTRWGITTAWITISLVLLLVISILGLLINARRLGALASAAQTDSSTRPSPALSRLINDPVLFTSGTTMGMVGLGIVCLMVVKPDLIASLAIIGVAALLGLACSAPSWQARAMIVPVEEIK